MINQRGKNTIRSPTVPIAQPRAEALPRFRASLYTHTPASNAMAKPTTNSIKTPAINSQFVSIYFLYGPILTLIDTIKGFCFSRTAHFSGTFWTFDEAIPYKRQNVNDNIIFGAKADLNTKNY